MVLFTSRLRICLRRWSSIHIIPSDFYIQPSVNPGENPKRRTVTERVFWKKSSAQHCVYVFMLLISFRKTRLGTVQK